MRGFDVCGLWVRHFEHNIVYKGRSRKRFFMVKFLGIPRRHSLFLANSWFEYSTFPTTAVNSNNRPGSRCTVSAFEFYWRPPVSKRLQPNMKLYRVSYQYFDPNNLSTNANVPLPLTCGLPNLSLVWISDRIVG